MRNKIKNTSSLLMIMILGFLLIPINAMANEEDQVTVAQNNPMVSYSTHIQNIGWQDWKNDGQISGTEGQGLRLEAIKIKIDKGAVNDLNVRYDTYVENYGWQAPRGGGAESGQVGKGLRLEAIRVYLIGDDAEKYDIYYQVHAQNFSWLGWAKNGENAGTADFGYRLEGIKIVVLPKGAAAPGSTAKTFISAEGEKHKNVIEFYNSIKGQWTDNQGNYIYFQSVLEQNHEVKIQYKNSSNNTAQGTYGIMNTINNDSTFLQIYPHEKTVRDLTGCKMMEVAIPGYKPVYREGLIIYPGDLNDDVISFSGKEWTYISDDPIFN